MAALTYANVGLRFLLELCALAALGYWGYHVGQVQAARLALASGLPLLGALVCGVFVSPRAPVAHVATRWAGQLLVFSGAIAGLAAAGQGVLAVVLALVMVLNAVLLRVWGP